MRTITALLVSVALAVPAPAALAQEALSRGAEADAFKQLAAGIPLGSRVKVRTTGGRRLTATLVAVEDERIVFKRLSRVPEPAIAIGYDADIPQAKSVIEAIVAAESRIAKQPLPEVAVQEVLPTAVMLAVRVWVNTADYGSVRSDLLERIKRSLDKYGLSIPAEYRLPTLAVQTASK